MTFVRCVSKFKEKKKICSSVSVNVRGLLLSTLNYPVKPLNGHGPGSSFCSVLKLWVRQHFNLNSVVRITVKRRRRTSVGGSSKGPHFWDFEDKTCKDGLVQVQVHNELHKESNEICL